MENFIDKFIFNPDNLSISEFLANYFINIFGYALSFFILLSIAISVFEWIGQGVQKEAIKKIGINVIMSTLVVSLLLFSTGRKEMYLSDNSVHNSYWIVDTLNDIIVLGNRFADYLTFNLLFGTTYTNSGSPLFEFEEGYAFKIKNYDNTPTGDDYVDGFFVSGLTNLITKETNTLASEQTALKNKIESKYNDDLENYQDILNKINHFFNESESVDGKTYDSSKIHYFLLFYRDLLKDLDNLNIRKKDDKTINGNDIINAINIYLERPFTKKEFDERINIYNLNFSPKIDTDTSTDTAVSNSYLDSTQSIVRNYILYKYLKYQKVLNIGITTESKLMTSDEKLGDFKYDDTDFYISKENLKNFLVENILSNDPFITKGFDVILDFFKNSLKITIPDNLNERFSELKGEDNYDTLFSELENSNINKYNYELFTKEQYNYKEASEFAKIFISYMEMEYKKSIYKLLYPINLNDQQTKTITDTDEFETSSLYENTFKTVLYLTAKNYHELNNNTFSPYTIARPFLTQLNSTIDLAKINISQLLNQIEKNSFIYSYSLGDQSEALNDTSNNGFLKLNMLLNDNLLKSEFNNIFKIYKETTNKNLFSSSDDFNTISSFHWYDLGKVGVGLKNLFLNINTLHSNIAGYDSLIKSQIFFSYCLPIYQNKLMNKTEITNGKDLGLSEIEQELCFYKYKDKSYSLFDTFAKTIAVIKGLDVGISAAQSSYSFLGVLGNAGVIAKITTATLIGTGVGLGVGFVIYIFVYSIILFIYFLIPMLFFYISIISWIFRVTIAMVIFSFSIVLFLFNNKKNQLPTATMNFITYTLMPLFITFMFFLIINTSFVMSITVDNLFPNLTSSSSIETYTTKYNDETKNKDLNGNDEKMLISLIGAKVAVDKSSLNYVSNYLRSIINKSYSYITTKNITQKSIIYVFAEFINIITANIKLFIIIIMEMALYINLWKVDRFVNEVFGTNLKSTEFTPDKILMNFGPIGKML